MEDLIPVGTKTIHGEVMGIHSKNGERSYFCVDERGTVKLVPSDLMGVVPTTAST